MVQRVWPVRLSRAAEADFEEIIAWTVEQFGERQALVYANTLSAAIDALHLGPTVAGVKQRPEIGSGICTLHVAREGKRGRHFVLFRVSGDHDRATIDVLRFLHDAMDLAHQSDSFT